MKDENHLMAVFDFLMQRFGAAHPAPTARPPLLPASLPADVVAFLSRREEFNDDELDIHLLDEQQALSRLIASDIWGRLGLVTLDDGRDSNPYVLITRGVCTGMVSHFFHDPEPRIEFVTLADFEAFLLDLRRRRVPLDAEDRVPPAHPEQAALAGALRELACADDDADADWLICFYLPLLRSDPGHVLEVLAHHDNFFVRESAAEALARIDDPNLKHLLARLAADTHPQVADAARRSIDARQDGPTPE